jgi:hypothetical protein
MFHFIYVTLKVSHSDNVHLSVTAVSSGLTEMYVYHSSLLALYLMCGCACTLKVVFLIWFGVFFNVS